MLLGYEDSDILMSASLIEPDINREASTYLIEHYSDLSKFIRSLEIKEEKVHDLLHDVFISLVEAENDGNGFNMEYGNKINEDGTLDIKLMDVAQFVYGRIKAYSKNNKYRTDVVGTGNSNVTETIIVYDKVLDDKGNEILDKYGNPKYTRRSIKKKSSIQVSITAATPNTGASVDNNDDFQKAFSSASIADDTDEIMDMLSMREELDYCIDLCKMHDVNIINILKNIDSLADMLGEHSKKKKNSESVFGAITELIKYHNEFAESLTSILTYSANNKAAFELLLANYY